jgi:RNA polymerase sigma factor (sigma-70 family)
MHTLNDLRNTTTEGREIPDSPLEDPVTMRLVRHAARQVRAHSRARLERQDVEQELALHILSRVEKFDPAVSLWSTFVYEVVRNKAFQIIRDHKRKKRAARPTCSLDDLAPDCDGRMVPLVETIASPSVQRHHDLRMDVSAILSTLPKDLREICERLMASQSLSNVQREMGLTKHGFRKRMEQLREIFTREKLSEFS